jgi:ribosome-binding protein aMBF1 (putative translation factor)
MPTLEYLFERAELSIEDVAQRAKLPVERVEAIIVGRWTPSPEERRRVAQALGVEVEEVSWGHSMDPRNLRYRRFGHRKD